LTIDWSSIGLVFGQVAGFFLDSCILLPQSLNATQDACNDFLNNDKHCFISQSVQDEVSELSKECYDTVCTTIRHYLKPALALKGITEITNKNGIIVATVFSEQKKRLKKEVPIKSNVRGELVGAIENYIAHKIHQLKDTETLSINDFLAIALTELENARYTIEKPFKSVKVKHVIPDETLTSLPSLNSLIKNDKDVRHIASAIMYQFQINQWVIFVTNDGQDILSNNKDIWELFALQCSSPVWALDYHREITKQQTPVEYYRNIAIPSEDQKKFGAVMEKILGIPILRKPVNC
jgi:hypothetical protein